MADQPDPAAGQVPRLSAGATMGDHEDQSARTGAGRWSEAVGPGSRFFRPEQPTEPMPLLDSLRHTPYRDPRQMDAPEKEAEARESLELAVRVGELLLRYGASAREVESSVAAVAAAAGLDQIEIDITNQSLLVQAPTPGGGHVTVLRVVRSSGRDLSRLVAVHQFVEQLAAGTFERKEATDRLRAIRRAPRFWPRWTGSLGYGLLAASVAMLLGGHPSAIVFSLVSAVLVDVVGRLLGRGNLPAFYLSAAGGAIATLVAWAAYLLGTRGAYTLTPSDFAYIVAAGIVVLLPGRAMTSAVEDAVTGYPVTGVGRLFGVGLTAAGIIVGVAAGLSLTLRLDAALGLTLSSPRGLTFAEGDASLLLRLLAGAIGATGLCIAMRSRRKLILPTAGLGAMGLLVTDLLHRFGGMGSISSIAVACTAMGLVGRLAALRLGAPGVVLVIPAISPLLPGLRIFRGMYELVSGTVVAHGSAAPGAGLTTLLGAGATALAIATGVVLGDVLSSPFDRRIVRRRRARRR